MKSRGRLLRKGTHLVCKDYGPKEAVKQPSYKPEAVPFRSTEPFDGSSTQRSDFVNRPMERVRRHEPETYRKPEGDLDLNTTAKRPTRRDKRLKRNGWGSPNSFYRMSEHHRQDGVHAETDGEDDSDQAAGPACSSGKVRGNQHQPGQSPYPYRYLYSTGLIKIINLAVKHNNIAN